LIPIKFARSLANRTFPASQRTELLSIVKYIALVCGNIYGSIKNHVPFL